MDIAKRQAPCRNSPFLLLIDVVSANRLLTKFVETRTRLKMGALRIYFYLLFTNTIMILSIFTIILN